MVLLVSRLDRNRWRPLVEKICVEVIFENGDAGRARDFEKRTDAIWRQNGRGWILKDRHRVEQVCSAARCRFEARKVESIRVERDSDNICAKGLEKPKAIAITWLFDQRTIAWLQEEPRHQVESLLRTINDEDLVGRHVDAAGDQALREPFTQRRQAGRGTLVEHARTFGFEHLDEK